MTNSSPNKTVYENVLIGGFIYSIGYYFGSRQIKKKFSLNQFQQTPADATFSDVCTHWNGNFLIIEFKKDFDSLKKELTKANRLNFVKQLSDYENKHLQDLSKSGHYIGYSLEKDNKIDYDFFSYSDLANIKENKGRIPSSSLEIFINELAQNKIGLPIHEFEIYLQFLFKFVSSRNTNFSGIIMNYDQNGCPRFVRFDDLNHLHMKLSKDKELSYSYELER